jgi:hypothetical protein
MVRGCLDRALPPIASSWRGSPGAAPTVFPMGLPVGSLKERRSLTYSNHTFGPHSVQSALPLLEGLGSGRKSMQAPQ